MNFEDMSVSEILRDKFRFAAQRVYFIDEGRVFGVRNPNSKQLEQIDEELKELKPLQFGNVSVEKKVNALSAKREVLTSQSRDDMFFRYGKNTALRSGRNLGSLGKSLRDRIIGYEVFLEQTFEDEPLTQGFISGVRRMLERERNKYFGVNYKSLEAA